MGLETMTVGYLLLGVGALALVFAIISAVVGDIFDVALDVLPDGALSSTTTAATLAGFGFAGAAASFGMDDPSLGTVILIGLAGAVAGWLLAFGAHRVLMSQQQEDGATDLNAMVGRIVTVAEAPATPGALGTALVPFLGQNRRMSFRSDEPLKAGDDVVVDAVLAGNQIKVSRHSA
ncbi:hypothetical protein [Demequina rhizosphaerae]|uniref:hypothetical protein n=1 Tax=Demequina rhizosphaerae TaxID=1638985 RepID=UPI000780A2B2|nr:hypothetical protein [Demequina rhizosphaerae]